MKNKIIFLLFSLSIIFSQNLIASSDDVCGTTSGSAAPYLPTTGNIKILVIFAQFKDDPDISSTGSTGWAKNSYPSWANNFINSSPDGSYPWNNLSHYFNEMSNGDFQVIGDVYDSLVITDQNESYYSSIGQVNREIILEVDPYVDFSDYDNLNGSSFGSDGEVDFIVISYRNSVSLFYYSGIARLEVGSTIYVDGKQIVNTSSGVGGGVQQRGGNNGRDWLMYNTAHEIGHHLFGGNHISYTSNLCLMSNSGYPVWNGSKGMHSWERQWLGWISYTDKSTDGSVTMSDYMTADQVYRIPGTSNEYFLIENRKKYSTHDKGGDIGFYIYRITSADTWPPAIDVLCADGNWNFSVNTSTETLTRTTPNVNGKDEMNYRSVAGDITYACYTPVYDENSAWGDSEDAFDLTFNNVLSPVSNPRTNNGVSLEFSLEVTGTNTITFYFDGDSNGDEYAGSPSKPQYFRLGWSGDHPRLDWTANTEPDLDYYNIYKKVGFDSYALYTTTSNNYYIDYAETKFTGGLKRFVYYKITAEDEDDNESVFTEPKAAIVNDGGGSQSKIGSEEEQELSEVIESYELFSNYPNPFNPATQITYQIPNDGFVSLIVYNSLGQIVEKLVERNQAMGKYSVTFNAENLPSGVYFYKLQAGEFKKVNKMLLLQ